MIVSWTAPVTEPENITEDFESYEPWTTDKFGVWSTVDADGALVQGLFQGMSNPLENTAYAYTTFAPYDYTGDGSGKDMTATYPNLAPHSGNYYLASSYAMDGWNRAQQDNWLISPLLPGCEQTIKFWVNNNVIDGIAYAETFQILYSEKDKRLENFKVIDEVVVREGIWSEISVKLPDGANYFAIRQISGPWDTYLFMIDDISYMYGGGDITGYNIYIDGENVGTTKDLYYDIEASDIYDGQVIGVSATYRNGLESKPINIVYKTSGMSSEYINGSTATFDIYSIDGVLLKHNAVNLEGLQPGVYIVGNLKIMIK